MAKLNDGELLLKKIADAAIPHGLPDGVPISPMSAVNSSAITTTTGVAIKAAVAGKRHWITEAVAINEATTEDAVFAISDEDDNEYAIMAPVDADGVNNGGGAAMGKYVFNPPLVIPAGKAIEGIGKVAVLGDVWCSINGFVED
ncbi:MAG: hypothetical protein FVQ84_08450 [Planctomycetes bacterium]|nr:hypothetical protein [Planctomycetota bacterium]